MTGRLRMAVQWIHFLARLRLYYLKKKGEWKNAGGAGSSPRSNTSTVSETGGGLKDYLIRFEDEQKAFGSLSNGPHVIKTYNQDELKLPHDPDLDEQSETPNAAVYKSESTPAPPSFTSVNGRSIEKEFTSETSTLPLPDQTMSISDQRLGAGSTHASQGPFSPYGTPRAHPIHYPRDVVPMNASTYYFDSGSESRMPQPGQDGYQAQSAASVTDSIPYQPPYSWQSQPQQPHYDPQRRQNLETGGASSVNMSDLCDMVTADDAIGDANYHFGMYSGPPWPTQVPEHPNAPFDYSSMAQYGPGYPNMNSS